MCDKTKVTGLLATPASAINTCILTGSAGFPATGSKMNKWTNGGPDDKTCSGFTGFLAAYTFGNSTTCDEDQMSDPIMFDLDNCNTCQTSRRGFCATNCLGVLSEDLAEKYCKSPTDVCVRGWFNYLE